MISAKEEQDAMISPAMDGLLRVHRRAVDGLDGEPTRGPPTVGNTILTRLLVPSTQAGILIGKQGATIKSIQEASKAIVRILDNLPPFALRGDNVVEIQGEPAAMHKAVELIASHLRKFLVDHSVIPIFEMQMSMPHPHMEQSMQMHHMEQNMQMHMSMPNPHMDQNMQQNMPPPQMWNHHQGLPPNSGDPSYGGNHQFMPQRPHDNFYPPPEIPPVEKPPHHGISTYGRDAPPMGFHPSTNLKPPPMASQVTHMQVPLSYADAVIGAAGASISYIRRSSGASVTIQESRGAPGEMTVEISGSAAQIQTAQQLIQNFMAGAAPTPAPPAAAPPQNQMAPVDHGYSSYPSHGPVYGSPPANAGPVAAHVDGGFGSAYGANYRYY